MKNNIPYGKTIFVFALFALFMSQMIFAYANPALVDLGTSGDFVVLSKAGISTTGTTAIIGDIGVSPIDSTAITGFGLIMDPSNTFSRSSLVTGKVYASNYAPTTPAKMTTAVSDMETAYVDLAGRSADATIDSELGGVTFTRGVYTWPTGATTATISTDMYIDGSPDDIFIFQIAGDLDISSGKKVILSGGALAKNVYWQVAGKTTLNTNSVFNGNIVCSTLIEQKTGAKLNGRALAQTAVTLDANLISLPAAITTNASANITECIEINTNGTFRLMNDLEGANISADPLTDYACIKITAQNITLDCNGFSITNNGTADTTYGILLTNESDNVTIMNCPSISQYNYGIYVYNSTNTVIDTVIVHNNSIDGFVVNDSINTTVSNVISFNNTGAGFSYYNITDGYNVINSANAHDNFGDGFKFIFTVDNNLTDSFSSNNGGAGFFFNVTGLNTLEGNDVFNNVGVGKNIIDTNLTATLGHVFNNSPSLIITRTAPVPKAVNMTNRVFDNPSGTLENYTSLTIYDLVSAESYSLEWTTEPIVALDGNRSFAGKFIKMTNITAVASISSLVWNWDVSEITSNDLEATFALYEYNSSGWFLLNDTPDTVTHTLSFTDLEPHDGSVYGIFQPSVALVLILPENDTYDSRTVAINYTAASPDLDTCGYSLDGAANVTLGNCTNTTIFVTNGSHTITVFANDTFGVTAEVTRVFTIDDNVAPDITIESPTSTNYTDSTIELNYTVTGDDVDTCWISLDVGVTNLTIEACANLTIDYGFNGEDYEIYVYVNDTLGNEAQSKVKFNISDTDAPIITTPTVVKTTSTATITWSSDTKSNVTFNYGTTTALGTTVSNSTFVLNHSVRLTGLAQNTLYYYNITSCDIIGNCNETGPYNFTTNKYSSSGGSSGGSTYVAPIVNQTVLSNQTQPPVNDTKPIINDTKPVVNETQPLPEDIYVSQNTTGIMVVDGQRIIFYIDGVKHTFDLSVNMVDDFVGFDLDSGKSYMVLLNGDSKKRDISGDGNLDLSVMVDSIGEDGKASVTIKFLPKVERTPIVLIEEPIYVPTEEVKIPSKCALINIQLFGVCILDFFLMGVVGVVIIIIAYFLLTMKKPETGMEN